MAETARMEQYDEYEAALNDTASATTPQSCDGGGRGPGTAASSKISDLSSSFTLGTTATTRSSINKLRTSFNTDESPLSSQQVRRSTKTRALKPRPRRSNDLSDLTIDKLNYAALGKTLYGRDKEVQLLKGKLEELLGHTTAQKSSSKENEQCQRYARSSSRQLVLIQGYSGVGKSSLAHSLRSHPCFNSERGNGLFVTGKFDMQGRNTEPYSGISSVCAEMCGALLELRRQQQQQQQSTSNTDNNSGQDEEGGDIYETICQRIKNELGRDQLAQLLQVIPILAEVVEVEPQTEVQSPATTAKNRSNNTVDSSASKHRFHFAFLQFIRIIAHHFEPLVWLLDDLQWADGASLDLIEVLIADTGTNTSSSSITSSGNECYETTTPGHDGNGSKNAHANNNKLMIIGSFRSNEVDETHIFRRTIDDLEVKSQESGAFVMTQVEIGNLEMDAVHTIIQTLLTSDDASDDEQHQRTLKLAGVCHRKTMGNVFFLLQFLDRLYQQQLLAFNFGKLAWVWDESEIEASTYASDNVVDLLQVKMKDELSNEKHLLEILQLASCLGSTFQFRILRLVWEMLHVQDGECEPNDDTERQNDDDVNGILTAGLVSLEEGGYIALHRSDEPEAFDRISCSWTHDKIHEAASALIPEQERGSFGHRIGAILVSQLNDKALDSGIFVVVNLLNGGGVGLVEDRENDTERTRRLVIARLNYQASSKAASLSAFESSAKYAAIGIKMLPQNAWADHYELALNLYSVGAKAEGSTGNIETMEQYCKEVLSHEDKPIEDKLEVYCTWADSMSNGRQNAAAAELLLVVLKEFKCRFPKNSVLVGLGVVRNVVKIKATMKSRDPARIAKLDDPTILELMKLLDKLTTCLYMTKDDRMPLVVFRSLNWTLKYGYCEYSSVAFGTTGMMLTGILEDIQGGAQYAKLALALMDKTSCSSTVARTMFIVYSFLFTWTEPAQSMLKPLLKAYDIGLKTGDTESATWSIFHWVMLKFMLGGPLDALESDLHLYSMQMNDLKRVQCHEISRVVRQVFLNLLGEDNEDDPTQMHGISVSKVDIENHGNDGFLSTAILNFHGLLLAFFGEHVRHADLVLAAGHDYLQKNHVASPNIMWDTFLKGISCFAAARDTSKKKYLKMGILLRKKIKKWLDMGNPNIKHFEALLDAEYLVLRGKELEAMKKFEVAILLSARGGYRHDAAFANERLGEFQLNVKKNQEDAAYSFSQSIKYWRDWGATAKVQALQEKHAGIMPEIADDVPREVARNQETGSSFLTTT